MHKNTSRQSPVASDESSDMNNIKLENIHQRNISSCTNTGILDFIKVNKQNTHQYTDYIELGEINF